MLTHTVNDKLKGIQGFAVDIDGTITENGNGVVFLPAVSKLRFLVKCGYKVIFVTGRSSVEAYVLSIFCGTTKIAVGENGGVIATGPDNFTVLGDIKLCVRGYELLKQRLRDVTIKPVFNRLSEVVLARTFDMEAGKLILEESGLGVYLTDSRYAFHINQLGVDKANGLVRALDMLNIHPKNIAAIGDSETDIPLFKKCGIGIALGHSPQSVKNQATHVVRGNSGRGLSEAIDFVSLNYLRNKT